MKSGMHEKEKVETVRNYLEGKLQDIEGEPIYDVYNPAFGKVVARTAGSGPGVVDAAVDNAREAFRSWSSVPVTDRVKILFRLESLMRENADEIARIVTTEHGKTFDESYGEVMRAVENVESATAATYHIMGRNNSDIARGIDEELIREPIGVFAVIAPFNFPVMVPFWFIPYAIGLGNTVVVKPSEKVPLTMQYVSSLFEKAGIPPGVVSIVNGGQETVEALLSNRHISGYSFVGSTRTAEIIHRRGTETHRRVQAGASAKNYELVMPDADLKIVIPSLISSFFGNAGERCLAGSVLVTLPENHEKVVNAFAEAASKLRLGFGLDADTDMGPLIREDHLKRVESYIDKGVEEGASMILDGRKKRSTKHPEGYFLGPTIFDSATGDMKIVTDEIFGPVASVMEAENLDSAIEAINRSRYGNSATIFTSSGRSAREFVHGVEAGNFGVNVGVAAPISFYPFGGYKDSFFGDLHAQGGDDHVMFFTERKVVVSRW